MAPNLKLLSKKLSDAVDGFGETPDSQREEILKLTKDIRAEVENPVERIDDYVEILMEMGAIRLLMDWGAFERIPPPGSDGISYSDLAALVGADENLLRRMAWMLVSRGFLTQVSEDRVVHTKASAIFAEKESYAIYFKGRQAYLLHTPLHYNRILIFDVGMTSKASPRPVGHVCSRNAVGKSRSSLYIPIRHCSRSSRSGTVSKGSKFRISPSR